MDDKHLVRVSKALSKHLRHEPEQWDLTLQPGGWVPVETLLSACKAHNLPISRADLEEVVKRNDKQRFSFDPTGSLIRANQGHSVEVDLQLGPAIPPEVLYHGTGAQSVEFIWRDGLLKMSRHHVHLSRDIETARKVGQRHGRAVVFQVAADQMHAAGYEFFQSDNGVWLVDSVPPQYLQQMD